MAMTGTLLAPPSNAVTWWDHRSYPADAVQLGTAFLRCTPRPSRRAPGSDPGCPFAPSNARLRPRPTDSAPGLLCGFEV